jgi:mRNA interferase MazF
MHRPARGDVWLVDFGNPIGHEQGHRRPCVIVSDDTFNAGPAEIVIVVPATSVDKRIPLHIEVHPPEGGLSTTSYFKPEDVRSVSTRRLEKRLGRLDGRTVNLLGERLSLILNL